MDLLIQPAEEDTTETLALTQSAAFAAALNPLHHCYPPHRPAGCDAPDVATDECSRSGGASAGARSTNSGASSSDEESDDATRDRGPAPPAWRHDTPFRSDFRQHPSRLPDTFPEDAPPPARLLFTIQDSVFARSGYDGPTYGTGDGEAQRPRLTLAAVPGSLPSHPYQHRYSDRARAAQERRRERRRLAALEEAEFYDAHRARREFDRYREIAGWRSPDRRVREYRALCGYGRGGDGSVAAAAAALVVPPSQPQKGCLIIKSSQSAEHTTPVNCENSANKGSRGEHRDALDGFTTPRSSPDAASGAAHKPRKRSLAPTLREKRVRFAPLSAAEFDAEEPTHLLTPLPPKQAAQLEQQITNKSLLAASSSSTSSSMLRQMPYDPELHRQTLENDAILRQWEPHLDDGAPEQDDEGDDDNEGQGCGSRRLSHRDRRRRRSSERFTLGLGRRSLLDGDEDEGGSFDDDDPMSYQYSSEEATETPLDDDDDGVFDDEDDTDYNEHRIQIYNGTDIQVTRSTSPINMNVEVLRSILPPGTKISDSWLQILNNHQDVSEILEMPASHVWNDLALISRLQQPPVDALLWIRNLSGHQWLREAFQTTFETLLGTARFSYQPSMQSDQGAVDWQELCMATAEHAWDSLEHKYLQRLHEKLLVLTKDLDDKLKALAQLETSMATAIASLPMHLRQTWVSHRSRQISELTNAIADGSVKGRVLIHHQQTISALLCDFKDALAAKVITIIAPCDIDEDETGDMMVITSPIQNLGLRLFRGIQDSKYTFQVFHEEHPTEVSQSWKIEGSHIVADFYERFLTFVVDEAQDLDFRDGEQLLQLTTSLGRLQLVALDLMRVSQQNRIHVSSEQGDHLMEPVLTLQVELDNNLRLLVFYQPTRPRCVRWCLPTDIQVIRDGRLTTTDLPPSVAFALRVEHVSACRFVLSDLCESLQSVAR